jgi:translation initiation factor 1
VKDGAIELQGDHCERAIAALKAQGWQVRRSGG